MKRRAFSSIKRRFLKFYTRVKRIVSFDESQVVYNGKSFKTYLEEGIKNYHRTFLNAIQVRWKSRIAFLDNGFRPDEMLLYGLDSKEKKDADLFMSQREKDHLLISYYGSSWPDILGVLKDKYVFYSCLKDFFKREVTYIRDSGDRLAFLSFCHRHDQIFAKLNKGSCGSGAKKFSINNDDQADAAFNELVFSGEWIVEEVIKQNTVISAYNSSSVNTVRFPSFKRNGVVKSVFPCMRFGRAGDIVDNAGHGGLVVSIDQNTGEFISDAFDEQGNVFATHPDSKIPFRGFQVPQWDALLELVQSAHLALPDNQVYVAFDFALSENGWCLVEGNWGDWILQQVSLQKGLRHEFASLLTGREKLQS